MTDETNEIAEMIYGEMASSASVDGVTFDGEQRGFIVQALSDAALEMRRRSAPSVGQQESEKPGTWPAVCVQRAFVEGAAWWLWRTQSASMFGSERDDAEAEAVKRYGPVAAAPASHGRFLGETGDLALTESALVEPQKDDK